MRREYKLAADAIPAFAGMGAQREILEITEDGHRKVLIVVANADAYDVRDALARAYQDGREDNAAMLEAEGRLRAEPDPGADVPMVCTACRKPVERGATTGLWFHADTSDPGRCSRMTPVRAMVAAGNENVPSAGEV